MTYYDESEQHITCLNIKCKNWEEGEYCKIGYVEIDDTGRCISKDRK